MSDHILVAEQDGVATVTLNRPKQRNAISYEMWRELGKIATDLEETSSVRVVVFRGAGDEAFSTGADIKDFDLHRDNSAQAREYALAIDSAMDAIELLSKPTVSLIKGYCVGGGFELTHACDLRIAADNSRLGITAARLGIAIGYKEMKRLARLAGPGGALYVLLTGRLMEAQEALSFGLIHQVVPAVQVEEDTYGLAEQIARLSPLSHKAHKQILRTALERTDFNEMSPEQEAVPFLHFDTADYHEGRRAFLEKRRAVFKGE